MGKMLITQALDERDLLAKKINDKIAKASFVETIKHNNSDVMGARIPKKEYEKAAKASLQQIRDLIDRYQKIESAIVESNAKTKIETSYGTFTVASAIAMRSRIKTDSLRGPDLDFEGNLYRKMKSEYNDRVQISDMKNRRLQDTAEEMRLSILGKESRVKDDRPLEVVDAYIAENTTELVDPVKVKETMEELKVKSDSLLTELNTKIKVSNATTFIDV